MSVDYVELVYDIQMLGVHELIVPPDVSISLVGQVDDEALWRCYLAAFEVGDAQFFGLQTDDERVAYYRTLRDPAVLDENASVVLLQGGRVVGFAFVLAFEAASRHVSCMCVHPAYQGQGLGRFLLFKIIHTAAEQGARYIRLGTERGMRAFQLYREAGFRVIKTGAV